MKETAVMDAFDEIGTAESNLQDVTGIHVNLDLSTIPGADFDHALARSHIQSIDVLFGLS